MQPKMLKLTMFAGVVLTALLITGVAQANGIYVLPGPTYSGTFILNSDGTVTPVGVGGSYTGIQQQDKLWDNFGVGNLPVGTLLTLSFATVGSQDIHTISYGDPFGAYGKGASFHWSYDISVITGLRTIVDVASDIDQTRGSATFMTTLLDNNSHTYTTNFTQNGTTTVGTTIATFLPGVISLAVNDVLTINSKGSDVTGVSNSYTQILPTPEPGTLALFGSGIIGLAAIVRRKINP